MQQGAGLDVLGRVCVRLSLEWWCLSNMALQLDIAIPFTQLLSPCFPKPNPAVWARCRDRRGTLNFSP